MLKRNLALCMVLTIFLSGCGEARQNEVKTEDNTQAVSSENESNANTSNDEKLMDKQKVDSVDDSSNAPKSTYKQEVDEKSQSKATEKSYNPKVVINTSSLSTKAIEWSWLYSPRDNAELLAKYKGYGFGDESKKIIYLTFDEGYENGYTASILDTLKTNNVHATFFVTKPYVTGSFNGISDSELLKRMSREGHIIGNHSMQHKSMPIFTNETAFDAELIGVEDAVNSIPGCKMSKYFRPPEGTFSELSLYYTQKLGYKSIFFALAYQDYDVDNQPDPNVAKTKLMKNTRNGMICLLHAVSKTNAAILDSLIKEWKNQGYEFKSLDELPN